MVRLVFRPIPKSDERFARQYRCGPPPEFLWLRPLRHSSPSFGPDRHAHTRTLLVRSRSVGCAPVRIQPISFLTPYGFTHPMTRTHVRLIVTTFKTGRMGSPQADALSTQMPRHAVRRVLQTTIKAATSPRALDGIYRPIGAAFPNNPTRRQRLRGATGSEHDGLSPSLAPLSRELGPGPSLRTLLQTTIQRQDARFSSWALPVRSPLLRESLLVSFPPLIDMLKLSGDPA
ncbi:hypothetical protein Bca4012_103489 [Brassica carinata]